MTLWAALLCLAQATPAVEVRAGQATVAQGGPSATVAFLVVNRADDRAEALVRFECAGGTVTPAEKAVRLDARGWEPVTVRCSLRPESDSGTVTAIVGASRASVAVFRGADLTTIPWRQTFVPREAPPALHLASTDTADGGWPELRVPTLWNDNRLAWCRVHFTVPEAWRGKPLRLQMAAVDDNDITYFNGVEIGRTNGWDTPRDYPIPADHVRWGADNVIAVMVDNPTYGGGLYKAPILLLAGAAPTDRPAVPHVADGTPARPRPGRIGTPKPLRPMHVADGVLRYPNGDEVALWGVNIYPQSWYQFDTMKRLKLDMKAAIRTDFDHLAQMGVEAIRIHVFDREISDGDGNILDNEHLDLLDVVVAECSRRGIYMYFTPIAWWGGPNENKESFSAQTSKPGMVFVPKARQAAANYLRQFLTRKNRYTGRSYKDEPSLCVLEVMNEPTYFLYGDIAGSAYVAQGETPEVLERDHRLLRQDWSAWLDGFGSADSPELYPLFRYDQMRRYIREMVAAIRSTGAKQPIAISYFGVNGDDIAQAIADSECEAVTFSNYPGGWERVNDGRNLMHYAAPLQVDPRLAGKARLAYEFDTPATNVSCYLFPALAAHFRAGDVQIACQFQYDSIATARWNTDWNAHWLNWHYTPTKAVSFMIGGEAFRTFPRGVAYDVGDWRAPATSLRLGGHYSSFTQNNSIYAGSDIAMYARSPASSPALRWPDGPRMIVGTGTSRYVAYGGTGAYTLRLKAPGVYILRVNPDARLVGNSLVGGLDAPVAELERNTHHLALRLRGWEHATCVPDRGGRPLPKVGGGWLLTPGTYRIERPKPAN
jgi:hypothetical protein